VDKAVETVDKEWIRFATALHLLSTTEKKARSREDIHGKRLLSTVIHIFSTSGGKGVKADIPQ
jgi:hypothetical protein